LHKHTRSSKTLHLSAFQLLSSQAIFHHCNDLTIPLFAGYQKMSPKQPHPDDDYVPESDEGQSSQESTNPDYSLPRRSDNDNSQPQNLGLPRQSDSADTPIPDSFEASPTPGSSLEKSDGNNMVYPNPDEIDEILQHNRVDNTYQVKFKNGREEWETRNERSKDFIDYFNEAEKLKLTLRNAWDEELDQATQKNIQYECQQDAELELFDDAESDNSEDEDVSQLFTVFTLTD
jgi:hypothetical protein